MNRPPKVTIFCPSYNHENYVADTLGSIVKQTYPYTQVIIIDDASADSTPQIVKEYASKFPDKIKFIQGTENLGVGNRWNQMIKMIDGEYLACIGSDDILPLDAIEKRVTFMEENLDVDLLLTEFDLLTDGNNILKGKEKLDVVPFFKPFYEMGNLSDLYVMLLNGNFIQIGAGLIRLGSYDEDTKLLDHRFYYLHDYDQLLKLILNHKTGFIQDSTYLYRWHETNSSSIKNPKRNEYDAAAEMAVILSGQLMKGQSVFQRAKTMEAINNTLNRLKSLSEVETDIQLNVNSTVARQNENIKTENYIMENIVEGTGNQNQCSKIENDDNHLEFTGERFVPELDGQIAYEHLHRYAFASEYAKAKIVLDIASGEGYGSALLSKIATEVVGVDISEQAVNHAKKKYKKIENLSYHVGECKSIPCKDNYFDLVISFETLEHILEQDDFLSEIKRVLKKDGILLISTPNKKIYSDDRNFDNPYHLLELNEQDFISLLNSNFKQTHLWGQRLTFSSHLWPMNSESKFKFKHYQSSYPQFYVERNEPPFEAEYYIAVCSDMSTLPENYASLYTGFKNEMISEFNNRYEWGKSLEKEIELKDNKIRELQNQIDNYNDPHKTDEEKRIVKINTPNFDAYEKVVLNYCEQKDYLEAFLYLQKLSKENSTRTFAKERIDMLNKQIALERKEKKWNSKKSVDALFKAEKYIEKGKYDLAKKLLIEILNLELEHVEALNDLSVVSILENNFEYASEIIKAVLSLDQSNEVAIGNMNYLQAQIFQAKPTETLVNNSKQAPDIKSEPTENKKETVENIKGGEVQNNYRENKSKGLICLNPFYEFEIDITGKVVVCCTAWLRHSLGSMKKNNIGEIWNGQIARYIRRKMYKGEWEDICSASCPTIVDYNKNGTVYSFDELHKNSHLTPKHVEEILAGKDKLESTPTVFKLSDSKVCNLKCKMCSVIHSDELIDDPDMLERRAKDIEQYLENAKIILMSGNGDPFARKDTRELMMNFDGSNSDLEFSIVTNGLLLPRYWDKVKHQKFESINISMDAPVKEVYEKIRYPGKWEDILKTLELVKANKSKFRNVLISMVVMRSNYKLIPAFNDMVESYGFMPLYSRIHGMFEDENIFEMNDVKAIEELRAIIKSERSKKRSVDVVWQDLLEYAD